MIQPEAERGFALVVGDGLRDGLHRLVAMRFRHVVRGVIFQALGFDPRQHYTALFITHFAVPVQGGIARRRHRLMRHHPFDFGQIAL